MAVTPLPERTSWQALKRHHQEIVGVPLRELFASDPGRGERLTAEAAGLYLDYSKNRVTDETMRLLVALAEESGVPDKRDAMFRGEHINVSEDRPVLHVALRMPAGQSLVVDGADVVAAGARGARPDGGLRQPGQVRRLEGPHRQAGQERRQRRHRRIRSRPGDGVRGAAPLRHPRPGVPVRVQRGLHRLRRGDPRPGPGRDAVHHLLQDVQHAGDADQRHLRA